MASNACLMCIHNHAGKDMKGNLTIGTEGGLPLVSLSLDGPSADLAKLAMDCANVCAVHPGPPKSEAPAPHPSPIPIHSHPPMPPPISHSPSMPSIAPPASEPSPFPPTSRRPSRMPALKGPSQDFEGGNAATRFMM